MKKVFILVLISLMVISCSQSTGQLELKTNEKGLVDIYSNETSEKLIQNLTASFTDAKEQVVMFPIEEADVSSKSFSDKMGNGVETTYQVNLSDKNLAMVWKVRTFTDKPIVAGHLDIYNLADKAVRINQINPMVAKAKDAGIVLKSKSSMRFLNIEPDTWAPKSMDVLEGKGTGKFVMGISNNDHEGAVIGCATFDRFRGIFDVVDNRESTGLLSFNTYHNVDDFLTVDPQQVLSSEWIYIDCVNNVLDGLEEWATVAGKVNNAVVSDPPAVGFYTWYYYREHVSEDIMIENTRFLAENRDKFPVNYIHIDWGWQGGYSSGDTTANEKFPRGLRWLSQYIKDHDFTPSLWINPFMYSTPTADAPKNHPDIFLHNKEGELVGKVPIRIYMGEAFGDAPHMLTPGVKHVIDTSNPDAYDFLHDRYKWVRSIGYDMAMMDFLIYGRVNYAEGDRPKNTKISNFESVKTALYAAKKGLGKGGNILGCGNMYETCVGTSNLTRISYDAWASWPCVETASDDILLQYFFNEKLWTNYSDGLNVRDKPSTYWGGEFEIDEDGNKIPLYLTDDEAQFYTAVTGLSQSAVMYTEDIQRLKPDRQWLLSMVMPIYQEGEFRPVDLFSERYAKTLQFKCEEGNRKWMVASGLNWTLEKDNSGLDLGLLDLCPKTQYHAFDVFKKKYMGVVGSSNKLGPVNAHGVLMVNLVPYKEIPQFVGNDLHISQGGVEIKDEKWDEGSKILSITLNDLHGRKGHVYILVPSKYTVPSNAKYEKMAQKEGMLIKVPVELEGEQVLDFKFN